MSRIPITNNTDVTLGEVNRVLCAHIGDQKASDKKRDDFETYMMTKIDDLNLILKVFKWIGWAITVASSAAIIWYVTHFLEGK